MLYFEMFPILFGSCPFSFLPVTCLVTSLVGDSNQKNRQHPSQISPLHFRLRLPQQIFTQHLRGDEKIWLEKSTLTMQGFSFLSPPPLSSVGRDEEAKQNKTKKREKWKVYTTIQSKESRHYLPHQYCSNFGVELRSG